MITLVYDINIPTHHSELSLHNIQLFLQYIVQSMYLTPQPEQVVRRHKHQRVLHPIQLFFKWHLNIQKNMVRFF